MPKFAVIQHGQVVNTLIADTKEIAEMVSNATCIEFDHETNPTGIGHFYNEDEGFYSPSPMVVIPSEQNAIEGNINA